MGSFTFLGELNLTVMYSRLKEIMVQLFTW